jgi:hypothetical protein
VCIAEGVNMINDDDSQPLEIPSDDEDPKPDKDTRPVPRLPSEDSMDRFFEQPLSEQVDFMMEETEDDRKNSVYLPSNFYNESLRLI